MSRYAWTNVQVQRAAVDAQCRRSHTGVGLVSEEPTLLEHSTSLSMSSDSELFLCLPSETSGDLTPFPPFPLSPESTIDAM